MTLRAVPAQVLPLIFAATLAGCYGDIDKSDPRYAEMEGHNAWL